MRSTKRYIPALCMFLAASCMALPAFAQDLDAQESADSDTAKVEESAEMPVWVNDTLNAEIMMLEKKKSIMQLRSEIKKLEYEMKDIEEQRNNARQMPGRPGMEQGDAGRMMQPPSGLGQQPGFGSMGGKQMPGMMEQSMMQIPPEPKPEPEPAPEPKKVVEKQEPKKRIELPSVMRIAGSKGNLLAVLVYERSGGTCTVRQGDSLPKGGKVVAVTARGVTVETDKDTKKSLMFSREFSGRATGSTMAMQDGMAPPVMSPMPPPPLEDPYDSADMGADDGMSLY